MPSTDIVMAAAGAAATSQTYVEDVFSSYIYTGNGATQSINNGIALGSSGQSGEFTVPASMNGSTTGAQMFSVATDKDGKSVAVGYTSSGSYPMFAVSTNGSTWTTPAQMNGSSLYFPMRSVAVDGTGKFVAVGSDGSAAPVAAYSLNGTTWTTPAVMGGSSPSYYMYAVAVNSSGKFVAVGYTNATVPVFATSTDGITWTAPAAINGYTGTMAASGIAVNSSGKFVAIGYEASTLYPMYATSADGTTWSTPAYMNGSTTGAQMYGVAVNSSGKFVAVGAQKTTNYPVAAYSSDGSTWTTPATMNGSTTAATMYAIGVNKADVFVSTGFNGANYPVYSVSSDGSSWLVPATMGGSTAGAPMLSVTARPDNTFVSVGYLTSGSYPAYATGVATPTVTGSGGMVWIKSRSASTGNSLCDTDRGAGNDLTSNSTGANSFSASSLTQFKSNGFSLGSQNYVNTNGAYYASWTFRKAAKFFDVVTYTGTGVARTIAHNLGDTPGMIIVKCTSTTGNWGVYSVGQTSADYVTFLNTTAAQASSPTTWNSTAPTASVFSVGTSNTTNTNGASYVAYIFGNDTTANGMIRCGTFTTNGAGAVTVTLGWEPQYVMYKTVGSVDNWLVYDTARGLPANPQGGNALYPNLGNAEVADSFSYLEPTATGFKGGTSAALAASTQYIYMAIRKGPMRTPTDPTKVFKPIYTNAGPGVQQTTGFPVDMQWIRYTGSDGSNAAVNTRLFGVGTVPTNANHRFMVTSNANAEAVQANTNSYSYGWNNTGYLEPASYGTVLTAFWNFKRAPGFFDVVNYIGSSSTDQRVQHNLGVAPELIMVRWRTTGSGWAVYTATTGINKYLLLNGTNAATTAANTWGSTAPTSTDFGTNGAVTGITSGNSAAYLFATCPGVSKVGSYTGTGSAQTINCGLTGGARFVMIKRTDSTSNWLAWDTASGMIAGADYQYPINVTTAYVNANWVYTAITGFQIVTSDASVNYNGGSYIYLAIA